MAIAFLTWELSGRVQDVTIAYFRQKVSLATLLSDGIQDAITGLERNHKTHL